MSSPGPVTGSNRAEGGYPSAAGMEHCHPAGISSTPPHPGRRLPYFDEIARARLWKWLGLVKKEEKPASSDSASAPDALAAE